LTFEEAMRHVANQEGGYVNDPNDAGGKTFKGISTTFYRSLVEKLGYRDVPVWMLTKKERIHIYFKHFWIASGADRIEDPALALQVFDHAVNGGVRVAGGLLKKGNITPRMYRNARITYYKQRPKCRIYCEGWIARTNRTYQKGLELS
jgi:lysozyme family protein